MTEHRTRDMETAFADLDHEASRAMALVEAIDDERATEAFRHLEGVMRASALLREHVEGLAAFADELHAVVSRALDRAEAAPAEPTTGGAS